LVGVKAGRKAIAERAAGGLDARQRQFLGGLAQTKGFIRGPGRCLTESVRAGQSRCGWWSRLSESNRRPIHYERAFPSTPHRVTSAHRLAAAAVLRSAEGLDDTTTIAVVDAVARWLGEPDGKEYAYALLGAVTDGQTQVRAYGQLLGGDA